MLVIDNGSRDGTIEYLKTVSRINKLICNPADVPQWQKAYAIRQAHAIFKPTALQYFVWLDNDMVLRKDWLEIGHDVMQKHPELAVCSLHNDALQENKHKTYNWLQHGVHKLHLKISANGAIWLVHRSFFDTFGMPPVNGVHKKSVMEDCYYSGKIGGAGKFIAVVDGLSTHMGYSESVREKIQKKGKRRK